MKRKRINGGGGRRIERGPGRSDCEIRKGEKGEKSMALKIKKIRVLSKEE